MFKKRDTETLFVTPFHKEYWRLASLELGNVRMLVIAALVIAARVALNPLAIPIIPNVLEIKLSFWINAAGAMIYGPVVGALTGAVSDTLSCILFPSGVYFFPFIFVEMLGSFMFGLILYRAKLSPWRIILSRIAVVVSCNFILNPLIMIPYYQICFDNKAYTLYSLMLTVLKNLLLFPIESLILVVFLSAVVPALKPLKLVAKSQPKLYLEKKHYILVALLCLLSAVLIFLIWKFDLYVIARDFLKAWLQ
ncbi:MAG: folate family ECF transporter S component [Eubacteriales bacterium]